MAASVVELIVREHTASMVLAADAHVSPVLRLNAPAITVNNCRGYPADPFALRRRRDERARLWSVADEE